MVNSSFSPLALPKKCALFSSYLSNQHHQDLLAQVEALDCSDERLAELAQEVGLAGANRRSGLYINGERQKARIDNNNIVDQLEGYVRDFIEQKQQQTPIDIKIVE